MIEMSLNEINNYKPNKINYEQEENNARSKELLLFTNFVNILSDKEILSILKEQYNNKIKIPYKLKKIYYSYNNINNNVGESKIHYFFSQYYKKINIKIVNFSNKWGYNYNYIINKLKEDDILRVYFTIDPIKQTLHQHVAATWINKIPCVEDFKVPANNGNNAFYVSQGALIEGKLARQIQNKGKSIDFIWKYSFHKKEINFYATHKYTKEAGGAQDNQYEDVKKFVKSASECMIQDICFISITDGDFYENTYEKDDNKYKKIEYLKNLSNNRCKATNVNLLPIIIIDEIVKWLSITFNKQILESQDTTLKENLDIELKKLNKLKDIYSKL